MRSRLLFTLLVHAAAYTVLVFGAPAGEAQAGSLHTPEAEADRVTSLPGWGKLHFGLFAGYVTVSEANGRALFYIFAEATRVNPFTAPVVLWLNGGPGCSSIGGGFMSELGPFYPRKDGRSLEANPYSWNHNANIIFLESPAFVGFSYSNTSSDAETGDKQTALDNHEFLKVFFKRYPRHASSPFWLAGESYAGHYLPQLAYEIASDPTSSISFQGFLLGNPLTDAAIDSSGAIASWWAHGLISDESFHGAANSCNFSNIYPLARQQAGAARDLKAAESEACDVYVNQATSELGDINIYDIYEDLCKPKRVTAHISQLAALTSGHPLFFAWHHAAQRLSSKHKPQTVSANSEQPSSRRLFARSGVSKAEGGSGLVEAVGSFFGKGKAPTVDPCVDEEVQKFLNLRKVQAALHANTTGKVAGPWSDCSERVKYNVSDVMQSMLPLYPKLIAAGLKIVVLSGDVDGILPTQGTRSWVASLGLAVKDRWHPWTDSAGQPGGWAEVYEDQVAIVTVRNAGHMVPYTQPRRAYDVFQCIVAADKPSAGPLALTAWKRW